MTKQSINLFSCAVLTLTAATAYAIDPDVKCESLKLKFAGKYAFCRLKAESKAVKKNEAPDFTKCDSKFADKWTKIEGNAGAAVCPSEGDQGTIGDRIAADVDDITTLLAGGTVPECGNAVLDPGEDCDLGNDGVQTCLSLGYIGGGDLACGAGCVYDESDCSDAKYVFVTSATYQGDFFGLSGADDECQFLADAAALGGTYKAWLADDSAAPANSFTQSAIPYVRVDGAIVANDWGDLTNGSLINPIRINEAGGFSSGEVWTNVDIDGTQDSSSSCSGWTSDSFLTLGRAGSSTSTGFNWTSSGNIESCSDNKRLYCFEQ